LYSSAHRKSNYIGISIESMYTNWGNELFQLRNCPGKYEPCDFMGIDAPLFNGIEDQFTQMIEYGLDILDGINTQEAYLQLETKPQRAGHPRTVSAALRTRGCGRRRLLCDELLLPHRRHLDRCP
jgi:hypothetical protein